MTTDGAPRLTQPDLADLGWGEPFASAFEPHATLEREPGRVVAEDRGLYVVATGSG